MSFSVKMETVIFGAFLSMLFSAKSFAFTGGLPYNLEALNGNVEMPGSTGTVMTLVTHTTMPLTETDSIPNSTWTIPPNGKVALLLGRIEYTVGFREVKGYETDFLIHVDDIKLGQFDCDFRFTIAVGYDYFGSKAVVSKATANGVDSSEFDFLTSRKRCQVYTSGIIGPLMSIYSVAGYSE